MVFGTSSKGSADQVYSMLDDFRHPSSKRRHRRGGGPAEDDTGSLTYSQGSSHSGGSSAAGESTDSSFADIMKVIADTDGPELEELIKREGIDPKALVKARVKTADSRSEASSLNYSTDGETALNGESVLQTITGQPSDSHGPDGGGLGLVRETQQSGPMTENIVFAPADPLDRKHRKSSKTSRSAREQPHVTLSDPGTPPPAPKREFGELDDQRVDDLLYAKWWMCGFTDALQDLVPKR